MWTNTWGVLRAQLSRWQVLTSVRHAGLQNAGNRICVYVCSFVLLLFFPVTWCGQPTPWRLGFPLPVHENSGQGMGLQQISPDVRKVSYCYMCERKCSIQGFYNSSAVCKYGDGDVSLVGYFQTLYGPPCTHPAVTSHRSVGLLKSASYYHGAL